MQQDGNFVLYVDGRAAWATNTYSPDANVWQIAVWQEDGNLVAYDVVSGGTPRALWESRTSGRGMYLAIQDDCNVVIYDEGWQPLWHTGTNVCS